MQLGKIQSEDLIFSSNIEDDRTNTLLTLDDYDWMMYNLSTKFRTEQYGLLQVKFKYFGTTVSTMEVTRIYDNISETFEYEYSTDIFIKYIKQYMKHHLESWDSAYAFNGEEDVLAFYNEVIEVGIMK